MRRRSRCDTLRTRLLLLVAAITSDMALGDVIGFVEGEVGATEGSESAMGGMFA